MRPTPIAETKNPTMRVAVSIPKGPILSVSLLALARQRYVTIMVPTMAAAMATNERTSLAVS
jgi:hypothetical protein